MSPVSITVLLLLSACLCTQVSGRHPVLRPVPLCCTKVSAANVSDKVLGEPQRQEASGSCVEALIFRTRHGKVCVDPEAEWTKEFTSK